MIYFPIVLTPAIDEENHIRSLLDSDRSVWDKAEEAPKVQTIQEKLND
jgi:hypothetical protein